MVTRTHMAQSLATIARPSGAPGVCTLYLVRHGTTTLNRENRYRGRRDVPLDAQGYQDAVATAQIIADESRVPDIRILHGLINVDYGMWEGMTTAEAEVYDPEAFGRYRHDPLQAVCPSGEGLADAQHRMWEALNLVGKRHRGESVAAVTHAVTIRLALLRVVPIEGEQWRVPLKRGSVTTVELGADGVRVLSVPQGGDAD
jgi:broad specificity phosphatase PhoE